MQSTNEELITVNEELESRNIELDELNNDLVNLLGNIQLPILMLGANLCIRQFTPPAERLLNLIGSDLGRPISNIKPNIEIPDLESSVLEVIDTMDTKVLELPDAQGHWYSVRIRPYKTLDNRIEGVVITFIDIDGIREAEQLRQSLQHEQRLATVVRDSNDAVTVQDFSGRILAWNPSAERIYGYPEKESLSMNIAAIMPEDDYIGMQKMLKRIRAGENIQPFETCRITRDGRRVKIWLAVSTLLNEQGVPTGIATTERPLEKCAL